MTMKERIPCSFYDIPGLQDWLDEMALLGLFLKKFNYHRDMAIFEVGEPKAVRYRLDPVGKSKRKDRERVEPYQEAGWTFVTRLSGLYSIYACGDPDAPELYSDPQSLGLSFSGTVKKQIQYQGMAVLFVCVLMGGLLFLARDIYWAQFLLWEHPRALFALAGAVVCIPGIILAAWLDIRKLRKIQRTLEQGLPLKAKKRRNRPLWIFVWLAIYLPLTILPRLLIPDTRAEVCGLNETTLSRSWPTLGQLEDRAPRPLAGEPEVDGHIIKNDSWFVPVQEYVSIDWEVTTFHPDTGEVTTLERPYSLWMAVRYDQARSPEIAQWVYQIRQDEEADYLKQAPKFKNPLSRITDVQPFEAVDWPGLDRLEVACFRRQDQDCWTLLALRGNEVLVVYYRGEAQWEDCLPLFLEALD